MNRDHILGWHEHMRPLGPALRSLLAPLHDTRLEDFERGDHTPAMEAPEPELPEGAWEAGPGVYKARCRSCNQDYELCFDPMVFSEDGSYCGGSDRCMP